jgi:hypothetical protein
MRVGVCRDTKESEDEGEGFGEISEAKCEAHESGVSHVVGGEVLQQSGDGKEKECLEEGVGVDLAHAEFALGGDDEEGDAEIAEAVTVQ